MNPYSPPALDYASQPDSARRPRRPPRGTRGESPGAPTGHPTVTEPARFATWPPNRATSAVRRSRGTGDTGTEALSPETTNTNCGR